MRPPLHLCDLFSVNQSMQGTRGENPDLAEPEIGASLAFDKATSIAAGGIASEVLASASGLVAPEIAIGYAVYAGGTVLLGSHLVKSYAGEIVKSVFSSMENSFAQTQGELERALYDYVNSPVQGGGL
jgi:hypothetical protein